MIWQNFWCEWNNLKRQKRFWSRGWVWKIQVMEYAGQWLCVMPDVFIGWLMCFWTNIFLNACKYLTSRSMITEHNFAMTFHRGWPFNATVQGNIPPSHGHFNERQDLFNICFHLFDCCCLRFWYFGGDGSIHVASVENISSTGTIRGKTSVFDEGKGNTG